MPTLKKNEPQSHLSGLGLRLAVHTGLCRALPRTASHLGREDPALRTLHFLSGCMWIPAATRPLNTLRSIPGGEIAFQILRSQVTGLSFFRTLRIRRAAFCVFHFVSKVTKYPRR